MILPAIWRAFNRAQERGAVGGIILILRQSVVPGARIASYQDVVMDESIRIARVRRVWNAAGNVRPTQQALSDAVVLGTPERAQAQISDSCRRPSGCACRGRRKAHVATNHFGDVGEAYGWCRLATCVVVEEWGVGNRVWRRRENQASILNLGLESAWACVGIGATKNRASLLAGVLAHPASCEGVERRPCPVAGN